MNNLTNRMAGLNLGNNVNNLTNRMAGLNLGNVNDLADQMAALSPLGLGGPLQPLQIADIVPPSTEAVDQTLVDILVAAFGEADEGNNDKNKFNYRKLEEELVQQPPTQVEEQSPPIFAESLTPEELSAIPTLDVGGVMHNRILMRDIPDGAVIGVLRGDNGRRWQFMLYEPNGAAAGANPEDPTPLATYIAFFNNRQINPYTRQRVSRSDFQLLRIRYTEADDDENYASAVGSEGANSSNFMSAVGSNVSSVTERSSVTGRSGNTGRSSEYGEYDDEAPALVQQLLESMGDAELEFEYNEMALEGQVALGDSENEHNNLLAAANTLLRGMQAGAERTDEYARAFLIATADYMEAAAIPAIAAALRTIRDAATTVGSDVMAAIGTAIRLLLTHLEMMTPSRETMLSIVMIVYRVGRRAGVGLSEAIAHAARCIAARGAEATERVAAELVEIPPFAARIGAGALDLGGRLIRRGAGWAWDGLASRTPAVLNALNEGQQRARAFLQERAIAVARELRTQLRTAIRTAGPVASENLRRALRILKRVMALLRQVAATGSMSLARVALVFLRIVVRSAGQTAQIGSDLFREGGRILANGLVAMGQGLLHRIRPEEQEQAVAEEQIENAESVLRDAGAVTVPRPHLRQRAHPEAEIMGAAAPYGLRPGEEFREFGRTTAAEPSRMVTRRGAIAAVPAATATATAAPRIRERNAPIVRTLEEAGQPVPQGLRKGNVYRPGIGGRRRTAKRRSKARKTRRSCGER